MTNTKHLVLSEARSRRLPRPARELDCPYLTVTKFAVLAVLLKLPVRSDNGPPLEKLLFVQGAMSQRGLLGDRYDQQ